jgi:hypothetical protein
VPDAAPQSARCNERWVDGRIVRDRYLSVLAIPAAMVVK